MTRIATNSLSHLVSPESGKEREREVDLRNKICLVAVGVRFESLSH